MRSAAAQIVSLLALALLGWASPARSDTSIALFPTQNRAGDSAATEALERALWFELSRHGRVVEATATRDVLRRLRLRNGDRAAPELLRLLGEALQADWLVSVALHDAERGFVPRATVSARVYSSVTGELSWAGFEAASGLDERGLLGRGTVSSLELLMPLLVRDLLSDLPPESSALAGAGGAAVAVVPFAGSTKRRGTFHAETVTEAVRARLFRRGTPTLSPNRAHGILRRLQGGRFGGVTAETRAALHETGGAATILTGAVEAYDIGGSELEPEPIVTVAMRLIDGPSGRILWSDARERRGFDGQGLFSSGRVHARGALADRIVETLVRRLEKETKLEERE